MTYGGGLWRTWFDRDLSLAGKVIVRDAATEKLQAMYWNAARPLMTIPSLAIHLDRQEEFKPNKELHLKPVLATGVVDQLFGEGITAISEDSFYIEERHMSSLTQLIANDLSINRDQIIDFELNCHDSQPSCLVGLHEEFVSSPRLDNLASSLCSLDALIQRSMVPIEQRNNAEIDMIMLFDHEEIGS